MPIAVALFIRVLSFNHIYKRFSKKPFNFNKISCVLCKRFTMSLCPEWGPLLFRASAPLDCVVRGVHSAEIRTSLKLCHQCKKRRIVFLVMRTGGLRNLCTFLLFENENGGDCFINPPNLKRKYFVIGSKEAQHWEIKSALFSASTQQNTAEQEQQIWAMATLNTHCHCTKHASNVWP